MTTMLLILFASVGVGLLARDFGRRQVLLCLALSTALALIYFVRPDSMT